MGIAVIFPFYYLYKYLLLLPFSWKYIVNYIIFSNICFLFINKVF